jgi:hypothetical protein
MYVAAAIVGVAIGFLLIGFLAGLFLFRLKQRWCSACGETLTCLSCTLRQPHGSPAAPPNVGRW